MLQQDLQPDQDQDAAAGELRGGLEARAEGRADVDPRGGEQEGRHADEPRRGQERRTAAPRAAGSGSCRYDLCDA